VKGLFSPLQPPATIESLPPLKPQAPQKSVSPALAKSNDEGLCPTGSAQQAGAKPPIIVKPQLHNSHVAGTIAKPPIPPTKHPVVGNNATEVANAPLDSVKRQAQAALDGLKGGWGNAVSSFRNKMQSSPSQVLNADVASSVEPQSQPENTELQVEGPEQAVVPQLPEGVTQEDVITQSEASYQGGHPSYGTLSEGTLYLLRDRIYFASSDGRNDLQIPSDKIITVLEPKRGTFSKKMVEKAEAAKRLARTGKQVAKFVGRMMGGIEGRAIGAIGSTAAEAAGGKTSLGPRPQNRVVIVVVDEAAKHAVKFDLYGNTNEEMEESAKEFVKKQAAARPKSITPPKTRVAQAVQVSRQSNTQSVGTHASDSSKHRLMKNGNISGPLSLEQISSMIRTGQIAGSDLVSFETWIPVNMLVALTSTTATSGKDSSHAENAMPAESDSTNSEGIGNQKASTVPMIAAAAGGVAVGAVAGTLLSSSRSYAGEASPASSNVLVLDMNRDGIPDAVAMDTDHDGRADTFGIDRDQDGRVDVIGRDLDGDGQVDVVGVDVDSDGQIDGVGIDSDDDGIIDAYGVDVDGDGDMDAVGYDADEDGDVDVVGYDTDDDGEIDEYEDVDYEDEDDGDFEDDDDFGDEDY
jgi:hypothetical protein